MPKPKKGNTGYLSNAWKGGRYFVNQGYVAIMLRSGKRQLEHRAIMEIHLGRDLRPDEVVHHKNGDRADNRIDNLEVMSRVEHSKLHYAEGALQKWQTKRVERRNRFRAKMKRFASQFSKS